MGLFGRGNDDRTDTVERTERTGTSPGLVRALFTLLGVAAALFLIWLAQSISGPLAEASTGDYWWAMLFLAAAGLALGLSQLFGGWTKWGVPTLSPTVFLLGFLPTLIVGGWIMLAKQPQSGTQESRVDGWSSDLGIGGLVDDLATFLPAIPLIVGLVLAFSFDTTGPKTTTLDRERMRERDLDRDRDRERDLDRDRDLERRRVRDEDAEAYRSVDSSTPTTTPTRTTPATTTSDRTVSEELRTREDRPREDRPGSVASETREERDDPDRRGTV